MNRFWSKKTGRKMAVIICAALIFTGVFQNFVWAKTDNQVGPDDQDAWYKIFLNNIRVVEENGDQQEFEKSVSGSDIVIGGKTFQIGQHGQIVDAYGAATVSGNEMYIIADVPQVEICFVGNQAYFETMDTVSGNEGANVVLAKKHTLGAKISVAVEKGITEAAASVYPDAEPQFYYTNKYGQPVEPQAVRASEAPFKVRAEFCGIGTSADAVLDKEVEFVYRGYTEYGRDLQLWDRDGKSIEQIEQGTYYNVGKIVIPGYVKSPEDPFDSYELVIGGDTTRGKLSTEPVTIAVPAASDGDVVLTFYMENVGDENQENRTIQFLMDNTAPVVTKVSYKRSGDSEYTEWTEGTALKDADGIAMRFDISEAHDLREVKIVYQDQNGETVWKEIGLAPDQKDTGTAYVYEWEGSKPDVHYTDVGLVAVDMAGNTTTWGSASYLLDHTAPRVNRITWEKTEEPGVIREINPTEESTITARDGVTLVYHVTEANEMGTALLRYVNEDGEEAVLSGQQKRETEAYTGYTFTYQLGGEDAVYHDLQLFLEDELGNVPEQPTAKLTAIVDHTAPQVSRITWEKTEEPGVIRELSSAEECTITARDGITLTYHVTEANEMGTALLRYIDENGEEAVLQGQQKRETEAFAGYTFTYHLDGEDAAYHDLQLFLEDELGNAPEQPTAKLTAIVDRTAPQVSRITWEKTEEPGTVEELSPAKECTITARDGITLVYHVTETNEMGTALLRYINEDGEEAVLPGRQKRETEVYTGYTFTYQLGGEDAVYHDLQLFLEDELGNAPEEPTAKLTAILDHTPPTVGKISWSTDKQGGAAEIKGAQVLVDDAKISLIVDIEEDNLETIGLYYVENGEEKLIEERSDGTNFVFEIDTIAYNYKPLLFRMLDKSGNSSCYGRDSKQSLMVIIDPDAPEMKELTYTYPQMGIWYRNQREPLQYSFVLTDYSEIGSIRMISLGKDGTATSWDLTKDCKRTSGRDEKGYYHYQVTTGDSRFVAALDQNQQYYFVVEDQWGNELSTMADAQNIVNMRIDNTAPSSAVYVKFSGDLDRLYNDQDKQAQVENQQYQYGKLTGKLFNNSFVDITVYVADLAAENAVKQAASGVKEVKVTYRYTEKSLYADKEKTGVLTYSSGNTENAIKTASVVQIDDRSMAMDEIQFRLSAKNGIQISSIEAIEITDVAGNKTVVREYGDANDLVVDYILDSMAPKLSHIIPNGSNYGKDANTYYYNTNRLDLAVLIAEDNFYPEEVISSLRAADATRTITMGSFQDMGDYSYRSDFEMKDGDGKYQFTLSYTDRSGNDMVFKDGGSGFVTEGTYMSPVLVLDTTPPVLNINYYCNGQNISDKVYRGECINGDVTAVIHVTEVNFDPGQVEIAFSAVEASGNQGFDIAYNPSGWSQSGDTYSYSILCSTEGHYTLTASCVDKAGNRSAGVAASDFTVDKTIPEVNIAYDTTTENGYYNTNRVATVTVTDQNFDENAVEYMITSTGAQPSVGNWTHAAANGCNEAAHVKGCRWSCSVVFLSDADYGFTFQCTDKAGNLSGGIEEETFTIDQTPPVIQVSYDNNESLNGYYFKEARNAVVTINEHNFDSSDVKMTVSSPDGEPHSPSPWRNSGTDVYVCEIPYDADGDYTFDIAYTDLAGNAAEEYAGDRFIIDMTAPKLDIGGVYDKSANNGVVEPEITYTDKNFDVEGIEVSITGANRGKIEMEYSAATEQSGQTIRFVDFPHEQEMDDLYTLVAAVTDKAGNTTEESIIFSVNRFGSVYVFSEDTQSVLEQFYVNQGPRLLVTEINVDTLEHREISFSCDGNIVVLRENEDYTMQESGDAFAWKEYLYDISGSNFESEGVYVVTIQSIDRATNDMTNRLKEKNIEFIVDKSAPSVVTGGIEDGGSYAETARSLTIDAVDNIYLTGLEIYLNKELVASYGEDELAESYGMVSYEVKEMGNAQTVYVVARDAAGNVTQTESISFLISSNAFIRWYYNKPLFIGSIAGAVVIVGGGLSLIFWKKKKMKM